MLLQSIQLQQMTIHLIQMSSDTASSLYSQEYEDLLLDSANSFRENYPYYFGI